MRWSGILLAWLGLLSASVPCTRGAVIATWTGAGDGTWGDVASWAGGVPNGVDAQAMFGSGAALTFVNVGGPVTVGQMTFDSAGALYAISGYAPITLATSTGAARVTGVAGQHLIFAPLDVGADTVFEVAGGSGLDVVTGLWAPARNISKTGAGSLSTAYVRASTLTIASGAVEIYNDGSPAGLSVVQSLSIAAEQGLDLADNSMVVNYTGSSPIVTIRALLTAGYHRGRWDGAGIRSSSAQDAASNGATALAYAEASALGANQFMGEGLDGSAVLIKYTWYGDANLDGKVDAADRARMTTAGTDWAHGDFNFDGKVTFDDYALFNLGAALQSSVLGTASTPEPAGWMGAAVAGMACCLRRRRSSFRSVG